MRLSSRSYHLKVYISPEVYIHLKESAMAKAPIKDKTYDLVSVLYHASQGCQTCQQYAADAEEDNDEEAAQYFREAYDTYEDLIQRGKTLLKSRL
jgi:hypothetical protein